MQCNIPIHSKNCKQATKRKNKPNQKKICFSSEEHLTNTRYFTMFHLEKIALTDTQKQKNYICLICLDYACYSSFSGEFWWNHHVLLLWNGRMTLSLPQRALWCAHEKYYTRVRYLWTFHCQHCPEELYLVLPCLIKKCSIFNQCLKAFWPAQVQLWQISS